MARLAPVGGTVVLAVLLLTGAAGAWLTVALSGAIIALAALAAEGRVAELWSRWRWDANARRAYRRKIVAPQVRASRLRDDVDGELRAALRPLRVVRGANAAERERIRQAAGDDVRLEFLEEQPRRSSTRPRLTAGRSRN